MLHKTMKACPGILSILFFACIVLLSQAGCVFADASTLTYNSIKLSPSSGTIYGSNTAIAVTVDSGTSEFQAVGFSLNYQESVSYVGAKFNGDVCGASSSVTVNSSSLYIDCIVPDFNSTPVYNGTVVTLYFKTHTVGTASFTFSNVEPTITTIGSGSYNLVLSSATTTTTTTTTLPSTRVTASKVALVIGGVFLLAGVFFSFFYDTYKLFAKKFSSKRNDGQI